MVNGLCLGCTLFRPITIRDFGVGLAVRLERERQRRGAARPEVDAVDVAVVLEEERHAVTVGRDREGVGLLETHRLRGAERPGRRDLAAERLQVRLLVRDAHVPPAPVVPHVRRSRRLRVDARGLTLHARRPVVVLHGAGRCHGATNAGGDDHRRGTERQTDDARRRDAPSPRDPHVPS